MMREALPGVENVAPMNVPIFLVWDTVLLVFSTLMTTLWLAVFGSHVRQAIAAGAAIWGGVFCIFWIAMLNMNIATPAIAGVALLFALIEMVVAASITRWALRKSSGDGLSGNWGRLGANRAETGGQSQKLAWQRCVNPA